MRVPTITACLSLPVFLVVPSLPATAGGPGLRCNDRPVTHRVDGGVFKGTPGDDVILGSAGEDEINGAGGNDIICGAGGPDVLRGSGGKDRLFGGEGKDSLDGGAANDKLDGMSGVDLVRFKGAKTGVEVSLGLQEASGMGFDRILDIEEVFGTRFDDEIWGDDGKNFILGGPGGDKLRGGGGEDHLQGMDGSDLVDGGPDKDILVGGNDEACPPGIPGCHESGDIVTYRGTPGAVRIVTETNTVSIWNTSNPGPNQAPAFKELVGQFEIIAGSDHDDEVIGSAGVDLLLGYGGDDVLKGKGGGDALLGGDGNDSLEGGPGEDIFDGGANDPVTAAGQNGDTADFSEADADMEVDLAVGTAEGEGVDSLTEIENVTAAKAASFNIVYGDGERNVLRGGRKLDELYGRNGSDVLFGGAFSDVLGGGNGDDVLYGESGEDDLHPEAGDDTVVGGTTPPICGGPCVESDTLWYSEDFYEQGDTLDAPNAVNVDMSQGLAQTGAWGEDSFVEIENLVGSPFGDTLTGDGGDNAIQAMEGNDHMFGLGGNDILIGGDGTDTADGGSGTDGCEQVETATDC